MTGLDGKRRQARSSRISRDFGYNRDMSRVQPNPTIDLSRLDRKELVNLRAKLDFLIGKAGSHPKTSSDAHVFLLTEAILDELKRRKASYAVRRHRGRRLHEHDHALAVKAVASVDGLLERSMTETVTLYKRRAFYALCVRAAAHFVVKDRAVTFLRDELLVALDVATWQGLLRDQVPEHIADQLDLARGLVRRLAGKASPGLSVQSVLDALTRVEDCLNLAYPGYLASGMLGKMLALVGITKERPDDSSER